MFKTEPALRKNFYAALVILCAIVFAKNDLQGQDIHYSQFYNSPLNINPALTGIFNGDMRAIGSYRNQWNQIVPYNTFSGNYDMKVYPKKNRDKGFFGVGAILNYDQSGDGRYNIADLNLTGSYSFLFNPNNVLTAGILLGVASEGFNENGLTFDEQWTGLEFDPGKGSTEDLDNNRFTYLETGVGLNYRYQKSARTNFNLGVGAWHLNTPTAEFLGDVSSSLPIRIAFNFEGNFQLTNAFDIQLHALRMDQDIYNQTVFGGLGRIHINQKPGSKYALDVGASYRTSGFIIPTIALHYNQWYVGASYDFPLANAPFVEDHSLSLGGPEVHIRYIVTNVKPLSEKKACPIF